MYVTVSISTVKGSQPQHYWHLGWVILCCGGCPLSCRMFSCNSCPLPNRCPQRHCYPLLQLCQHKMTQTLTAIPWGAKSFPTLNCSVGLDCINKETSKFINKLLQQMVVSNLYYMFTVGWVWLCSELSFVWDPGGFSVIMEDKKEGLTKHLKASAHKTPESLHFIHCDARYITKLNIN